jgi:2,3-bisphosphoglycerate-independent phosphoglycerate mutase
MQVRVNYANPDMVGHTGDLEACKRACHTCDKCLADLLSVADEVGAR